MSIWVWCTSPNLKLLSSSNLRFSNSFLPTSFTYCSDFVCDWEISSSLILLSATALWSLIEVWRSSLRHCRCSSIRLCSSRWKLCMSWSLKLLSSNIWWPLSWVWRISSILCCTPVCEWWMSFNRDLISSSLSHHSSNRSRYSSSPQFSAFNRSISPWFKPRATSTTLISFQREEKVGVSILVVDKWPYSSFRKSFTRTRLASREVSPEEGFACHPNRGGDSPHMLVKRRKRRVMSKVLESGVTPPGGYNRSHWATRKTFFFNKLLKIE